MADKREEPHDLIRYATEHRDRAVEYRARAVASSRPDERERLHARAQRLLERAEWLEGQARSISHERSMTLMVERNANGLTRPPHEAGRRQGLDHDRQQQYEDYARRQAEQTQQEHQRER